MSEKWYGYIGKILRVDLSNNGVFIEPLDKSLVKRFIGCVGYAAKLLWDELKPGIDPLGLDNKLIIATGPHTGTLDPGSGSWEAVFKSPQTYGWGEARCGGFLGPELKFAGFDILIVEGRAEKPVYLWIQDGEVEVKSAEHLWGKNAIETEEAIREELGDPRIKIASIGPAGEKLVRFACIMTDMDRAAGRGGCGAVMGSKNLKAIAVRGHGRIEVPNPGEYLSYVKEIEKTVGEAEWRPDYMNGTISFIVGVDDAGDLPTKHGISNHWGKGSSLYEQFKRNNFIHARGCYGCYVACGRYSEVRSGRWATPPHGGPEYETLAAFSSFLLNEDLEAVMHANYLCNILGLDTISCGNVIGFAMECYERGWLTKESCDGLDLAWGNADSIIALVKKIAAREGIGNVLAEGVKIAAEKIGKDAPKIALHVKGLEMPMHDPRAGKSLAVQYGTANRGMCHIHPAETVDVEAYGADFGLVPYGLPKPDTIDKYKEKGKADWIKLLQDASMSQDILGVCRFFSYLGMTPDRYAKLYELTTGFEMTDKELIRAGERVSNLQRCFNVREGMRRKDDLIPERIKQIPAFGKFSDVKETAISDYEAMLDEYYEARGWNSNGIPTREKLIELALEEIAEQIDEFK